MRTYTVIANVCGTRCTREVSARTPYAAIRKTAAHGGFPRGVVFDGEAPRLTAAGALWTVTAWIDGHSGIHYTAEWAV